MWMACWKIVSVPFRSHQYLHLSNESGFSISLLVLYSNPVYTICYFANFFITLWYISPSYSHPLPISTIACNLFEATSSIQFNLRFMNSKCILITSGHSFSFSKLSTSLSSPEVLTECTILRPIPLDLLGEYERCVLKDLVYQ